MTEKPVLSGVSWEEAGAAFAEFGRRLAAWAEGFALAVNTAWYTRPRTNEEMAALWYANREFARRHHYARRRPGATVAVALGNLDPAEVRRRRRKPSMG